MSKVKPQFLKRYIKFADLPPPITAPFINQRVTIPNPQSFVQKIYRIRNSCPENTTPFQNLQFISDYDYTLTKFRHKNKQCDSLFGLWSKGKHLPKKFIQDIISNYRMFGPYQTDDSISFEERTLLVGQLYKNQLKAYQKHRITEQMVYKVLVNGNIVFRSHTKQFLQILNELGIPLYIISGGISDYIYNTLHALCGHHNQNVSIHSNEFQFYTFSLPDEEYQFQEKRFVRFKKNIIHSYNKYKVMNHEKKRKNCFLMGDLVSDIYMAQGNGYENIISVFYGKQGENHQRALAEEKFDIIVEGDCSHKILIQTLKLMGRLPGVDWTYLTNTNSELSQLLQ